MDTIRAVYENGVFRPMPPIDLPDHSVVEFEPRTVDDGRSEVELQSDDDDRRRKAREAIYEILSHRYNGGEPDIAARHNEHQP